MDGGVWCEIIENERMGVMNFGKGLTVLFCDEGGNEELMMNGVGIRMVE